MSTAPTIDPEVSELQRCGFEIKPWWAAAAIAEMLGRPEKVTRIFRLGSAHGLLEILPDAINVIALSNDKPHNGQFKRAVTRLERAADNLGVTLRIVSFWNDRLRQWFVRRGYESGNHPAWGLYAERVKELK
jgi:hypothetical protein